MEDVYGRKLDATALRRTQVHNVLVTKINRWTELSAWPPSGPNQH